MDETKETAQGNSEKTTSGSEAGTTSDKKGKTFTEEQVQKSLSDAKAEFGRERVTLTKERDALKSDLESTTSRLGDLEKRINETELEGIRDNPELLKAYQQRQDLGTKAKALEVKERELAQREAQIKADVDTIASERKGATVASTAVKYGLNIEVLDSLGVDDPEALDKVAAAIVAGKPKTSEGGEGIIPDSGMSSGGLSDIQAREKANKDFSEGTITETEFRKIVKGK